MQLSSPSLAEQLSRNSAPYQDPLAKIHWDQLDLGRYWLPPQAISLYGLADFARLPEAQRVRLSQYEFLHIIEAGLWLEGLFMERITRSISRDRTDRAALRYRLHELREEAGHSLMFLELIARSGLSAPYLQPPRLKLVDLVGRYAPLGSLGFWLAVLLGEEVPDRLNRFVRKHGDVVSVPILEMCTAHIVDEARHIAYARQKVEARLANLPAWRRALLRPLVQTLLRQFIDIFYYPTPALYELAGLSPGKRWAAAARANPHRTDFIGQCLNPALQLLRQRGFAIDRE